MDVTLVSFGPVAGIGLQATVGPVNWVPTVSIFYSLLAIVANVVVIGVLLLVVTGHGGAAREMAAGAALPAAFGVALLATAGSLYFSEVAHFEPCRLCWYQRIAMYPLVLILGIAAWWRDGRVSRYVLPVSLIGAGISTYHYALEWLPVLDSGACSATVPCTLVWFRQLGFISLPYLALSAFLLIAVLVWLASGSEHDPASNDVRPESPR